MIHFLKKYILVSYLILVGSFSFASEKDLKTLLSEFKTIKDDTLKIKYLNSLCWEYRSTGNFDSALYYGTTALSAIEKLKNNPQLSKVLLREKANSYNNIGLVYWNQGNFPRALDYYFKALKINEEQQNKKQIAINLGNIGIVYEAESNYDKALEYYNKALNILKEINDLKKTATQLSNIAVVYHKQGNYNEALQYYFDALNIAEKINNKLLQANNLGNIAIVYDEQATIKLKNNKNEADELFKKAIDFYKKALKLKEELDSKDGIAITLSNIGTLYITLKKYTEAENYLLKAVAITNEIGALDYTRQIEELLSQLYLDKGDYKKAFTHFKTYANLKDSIFNIEKHNDITRKELNFEYEKKQAIQKLEQDKKDLIHQAEISKQALLRNGFIIGFALMIVLALVIYRSYKNKKKSNIIISREKEEVELQKKIIESKNKEIIDSIVYAKRIQEAILPSMKAMNDALKNGFVYYRPKDVVAGDFYWMEKHNNIVYFAVADCTGHGVPGALMSVVCSNALSKSLLEENILDTGKLLDKTREFVIKSLTKSGEEVNDGMDISLCAINIEKKQMQWSGANNPLWIIRREIIDNRLKTDKLGSNISNLNSHILIEYKADKQPIGKYFAPKPFATHHIELQKNDTIYIFSDGYQDQFGGEKGKKFKASSLKELLISIQDIEIDSQRDVLHNEYDKWKGNLEQVDDVCVIGVKI